MCKGSVMPGCEILDNSSVAAFVGAFSAYCLVIANDWRRNRKKEKLIKREIEMIKQLTLNKVKVVKSNRSFLTNNNKLTVAPIMKFPTRILNQLTVEVLDRLSTDQKAAIDALSYTMEATDGVLDSVYNIGLQIMNLKKEDIKRTEYIERILTDYEDAIVNLGRLAEMCQEYINCNYRQIITKQYRREDYIQ